MPFFPELSETQVLEKVRRALRDSKRYPCRTSQASKNSLLMKAKKTVRLYIVSDVHVGAHGFEEQAFRQYIARIANDNLAAVVVLGDLIDNATQGSKGCVFSQRMNAAKANRNDCGASHSDQGQDHFLLHRESRGTNLPANRQRSGLYHVPGLGCIDKYNYVHGFITIKAKGNTYSTPPTT